MTSSADSGVAERRLRPIYDCLDCGNNKRALQEADKLLRKHPTAQCAKALKCLALLRMGKEKECEQLIKLVHDEVPQNEATLQAMSICYRELHRPELICQLYAAAAEKQPASEDLLTHLFMSYVRVGDYKKQQTVAMALYKLLPKNPYYFWAVMSIVMQARTSKPELKSSIVLPLAERMIDKFIKQDKIEAEQEVQLYLMILEMQGKLEEMLAVIQGPLGEKLQSLLIPNKRVELLIKLKRWREANVLLKKMLKEEMDSWTYYKDYLLSVFHLIEESGGGERKEKKRKGEGEKGVKSDEKKVGEETKGVGNNEKKKGGEKKIGEEQTKSMENKEKVTKEGLEGGETKSVENDKKKGVEGGETKSVKNNEKKGEDEKGEVGWRKEMNEMVGSREKNKKVAENKKGSEEEKKIDCEKGEEGKKEIENSEKPKDGEKKIEDGLGEVEKTKNGEEVEKTKNGEEVEKKKEEETKEEEEEEEADCTLSDCAAFLSNIQEENQRASHRLRGPYLAQLEFYAMLKKHGKENEVHLVGDLVELFILYFHEFGGKQCCLGDLKPYLKMLSSEQATDFLNQVFKMVQLEEGSLPSNLQQMLRYLTNLQLSRCLGFHEVLDFNSKLKLATSLLHCYKESLHFNEGQLSTDFMNNDPYALLTAHILYDIWIDTKDAIFLKDACVVLEFALSASVSNYQIKLLLMKMYNMLGATREAYKVYELLDIKHMQLDTLGYLHLWPMLSTAQYSQAVQIFNTTLKFFTASCRESADHLTLSYKYGSFLKITEFVEFRDRINNSLHHAFVQVEKTLIDVMQATSHDHTCQMVEQSIVTDDIDWDQLEDNRDFTILWSANPPHRNFPQHLIEQSFQTEKDLLRLRVLLLKLLTSAINLSFSKNNVKSNREAYRADLVKYLEEMNGLYERLKKTPHPKLPLNIVEAPPESRLHDYIASQLVPLLANLTRTVLGVEFSLATSKNNSESNILNGGGVLNGEEFERLKLEDFSDFSDKSAKSLTEATEEVSSFAKANFGNGVNENSLNERLETIQRVTLVVELVCVAAVFCGVVFQLAKETMAPVVKKGKKKKDSTPAVVNSDPAHKNRVDCFESLVTSTTRAIKVMDETVNHLKSAWHPSLTNVVTRVDLLEFKHPFCQYLNESYISSLCELSSILRRKLRHIEELKL